MADSITIVGTIKIGGAAPEQCVIQGVVGGLSIWGPNDPRPTPPIYLPPGGGQPGDPPHPAHPIVLPPGDPPTVNPPEGQYPRWVYSMRYGWCIDPGEGGKPQPLPPASGTGGTPAPEPQSGSRRS